MSVFNNFSGSAAISGNGHFKNISSGAVLTGGGKSGVIVLRYLKSAVAP
jgi:hypothetical protein